MRITLDLTNNELADLEAVASELASDKRQARTNLAFVIQRAIMTAVTASIKQVVEDANQ